MPQTGVLGERENSIQQKALCNSCKDLHKRSSTDTNNSLKIITLKANYTHKMHYHSPALIPKQEAILCWSTSSLKQQFGACFPIMMSNPLLSLKSFCKVLNIPFKGTNNLHILKNVQIGSLETLTLIFPSFFLPLIWSSERIFQTQAPVLLFSFHTVDPFPPPPSPPYPPF